VGGLLTDEIGNVKGPDRHRLLNHHLGISVVAAPSARHWALGCGDPEVVRHYSWQDWNAFPARNWFMGDTQGDGQGRSGCPAMKFELARRQAEA
jgi:hypothetical protein